MPLVITHLVITVPIVVWVMIGFFEGLPGELEEAALMDGATIWQAFLYVAMPLARPGITVAMILSFIFSWNNFIFGVVLAGRTTRTLPVAVYNVLTFEQISWGPLAAAALIVTAPVLLLTLLMQKEIVAGLTAGGVKAADGSSNGNGRVTLSVWEGARMDGSLRMDLGLTGQVAVITGPAKGMGAAITRAFAAEGCRLALFGRDVAAIEPVADEVRRHGTEVLICLPHRRSHLR